MIQLYIKRLVGSKVCRHEVNNFVMPYAVQSYLLPIYAPIEAHTRVSVYEKAPSVKELTLRVPIFYSQRIDRGPISITYV